MSDLEALHSMLRTMSKLIISTVHGRPVLLHMRADTVLAAGEAAGLLSKAAALVARDIDDARNSRSLET